MRAAEVLQIFPRPADWFAMDVEARIEFFERGLLLADSPEEREPWLAQIERERGTIRAKRNLEAFVGAHPDLAERLFPGISSQLSLKSRL